MRGDRAAWVIDGQGNVGQVSREGEFVPKHRYDTVFSASTRNEEVRCGPTAHLCVRAPSHSTHSGHSACAGLL